MFCAMYKNFYLQTIYKIFVDTFFFLKKKKKKKKKIEHKFIIPNSDNKNELINKLYLQ